MKRNDLSCLAHPAVSSSVSIFGRGPLGLAHNPLDCLLAVPARHGAPRRPTLKPSTSAASTSARPARRRQRHAARTLAVSFTVPASGTLGTPKVFTQGAPNLDFTLASGNTCIGTVDKGATCAVERDLCALASGPAQGRVQIVDGSGNMLANAYIYGTGVGPRLIAFNPAAILLGSGFSDSQWRGGGRERKRLRRRSAENSRWKEILAVNGSIPANPTINTLGSGFSNPAWHGGGRERQRLRRRHGQHAVKEILAAGGYTTVNTLGSGFNYPTGVAVDGSGNVFVADPTTTR